MKKFQTIALLSLAVACLTCTPQNNPENPEKPTKASEMHKSPKRGVAFNFANLMDLPLLSDAISWDYNWGNAAGDNAAAWFDANDIEFCPMCWNGSYSKDKIREYVALHPSTKYLLAFNEPNLTDQANMVPSKAAELWPDVLALAKELNLKLVSPAMNYGTLAGYSDPIKWMDEFLAQPGVSIDDIDAISLHCYMGSASALVSYVEKFRKYNKPVWMTEFCAWESTIGSVEAQMTYMCHVLNYFETEPLVERYAWFIPRYKKPGDFPYMQLLTNGNNPELTDLGKMFVNFSTFDKTAYLDASTFVYGGQYAHLSDNSVQVRVCADEEASVLAGHDGLQLNNLSSNIVVTYQVMLPASASDLLIRYASYSNSIFQIYIDGEMYNFASADRTGSATTFSTVSIPLNHLSGAHTIGISLMEGACHVSGFYVQ